MIVTETIATKKRPQHDFERSTYARWKTVVRRLGGKSARMAHSRARASHMVSRTSLLVLGRPDVGSARLAQQHSGSRSLLRPSRARGLAGSPLAGSACRGSLPFAFIRADKKAPGKGIRALRCARAARAARRRPRQATPPGPDWPPAAAGRPAEGGAPGGVEGGERPVARRGGIWV